MRNKYLSMYKYDSFNNRVILLGNSRVFLFLLLLIFKLWHLDYSSGAKGRTIKISRFQDLIKKYSWMIIMTFYSEHSCFVVNTNSCTLVIPNKNFKYFLIKINNFVYALLYKNSNLPPPSPPKKNILFIQLQFIEMLTWVEHW